MEDQLPVKRLGVAWDCALGGKILRNAKSGKSRRYSPGTFCTMRVTIYVASGKLRVR